ncbi:MAG TPA: hypothetical protein VHY33_07120 [Thermoanaerobaculia bacterium]|nr:hypothetical protein [Thermoanaerobaculia bacterium]
MRFIDRERRHGRAAEELAKVRHRQPFGRDEEQSQRPFIQRTLDVTLFGTRLRAVELRRRDAACHQAVDLIFHQRDERRHDDRQRSVDDGRRLIAERFSTAGRHDDERVAPRQRCFHRLGLQRPERCESPMPRQSFNQLCIHDVTFQESRGSLGARRNASFLH